MGFLDKCKASLTDKHPERDESHSATRYAAQYEPEVIPGLPPAQDTLAQKFAAYDAAHPYIYIAIRNHVESAMRVGVKRISIKGIVESMRGTFNPGVKLNNSYTSRFARLIEAQEPDLRGYFELRELRAA